MGRITERSVIVANKAIAAGLRKHYAGKTLIIDGKKWTATALLAALADEQAQLAARAAARATWRSISRQARKTVKANHALRVHLRLAIGAYHGKYSEVAGDFGFVFSKRRKQTGLAKVAAAEKRSATRAARRTMGSRQRAKIVGAPTTPDGLPGR
jgi:hypothetical protein